MNLKPKAALGYLVGWVLIIAFVVLLSLIFSFLGTIICAALAGMMMGATRMPRLSSVAVSLIFPGVITGVLRLSHSELEDKQIIFLGILCLALYWVIYSVLFKLVSQEQASPARRRHQNQADAVVVGSANGSERPRMSAQLVPALLPRCEKKSGRLTLAALQGTWVARSESVAGQRTLVIAQENLLLTECDAQGPPHPVASATLKVVSDGSVLTLHPPDCADLCDVEEPVSI